MKRQANITDRALRYRAQNAVRGPRRCVICGVGDGPDAGRGGRLEVMHLDGNESNGESSNLAYGCRTCNQVLAAAFRSIGAGRPTKQFNPSDGLPTFQQYAWAVSNHSRGSHDEAGAIIHATPKHKRIEYAKRIAQTKRSRGTDSSLPEWARNPGAPGAFKRCVKSVSERGGARDPRAVCAEAGREKYGAKKFAAMAAAGRRRKNPAIVLYDGRSHEQAMQALKRAVAGGGYIGLRMRGASGNWKVTAEGVRKQSRFNPAAASAEVFEEFHGYAPSEVITVTKKLQYHSHLAAAGKLTHLDVWGIDGKGHHISGFKGAMLAFNEDKNQLFVEGGDQFINLEDYGIRKPHEWETLGQLTDIAYHTNKTHLGDQGGEAVYVHKFRSTNENGRHVIVRIARYPDLIYDRRNEQLYFSGGSYEILREGIDR